MGSTNEKFFTKFLKPYLNGAAVEIGLPISKSEMTDLLAEVEVRGNAVLEIDLLLNQKSRATLLNAPILTLDEDGLLFVVVIYQILFGFHGGVERGRVGHGAIEKLMADAWASLQNLAPPKTRAEVLVRHFLLEPFCALYRTDVHVDALLDGAYFGEEAPQRRLMEKKRVERNLDLLRDGLERPRLKGVLGAVFHASPLTRLIYAHRLFLHFRFAGTSFIFADQALSRLVVDAVATAEFPSYLAAFARGLDEEAGRDLGPEDVALIAQFLVYTACVAVPHLKRSFVAHASYQPPTNAHAFDELDLADDDLAVILRRDWEAQGWAILRNWSVSERPHFEALEEDRMAHAVLRAFLKTLESKVSVGIQLGNQSRIFARLVGG